MTGERQQEQNQRLKTATLVAVFSGIVALVAGYVPILWSLASVPASEVASTLGGYWVSWQMWVGVLSYAAVLWLMFAAKPNKPGYLYAILAAVIATIVYLLVVTITGPSDMGFLYDIFIVTALLLLHGTVLILVAAPPLVLLFLRRRSRKAVAPTQVPSA